MLLRLDLLCLTAGPMAPAHPVFGGAGRWTPLLPSCSCVPARWPSLVTVKGQTQHHAEGTLSVAFPSNNSSYLYSYLSSVTKCQELLSALRRTLFVFHSTQWS